HPIRRHLAGMNTDMREERDPVAEIERLVSHAAFLRRLLAAIREIRTMAGRCFSCMILKEGNEVGGAACGVPVADIVVRCVVIKQLGPRYPLVHVLIGAGMPDLLL